MILKKSNNPNNKQMKEIQISSFSMKTHISWSGRPASSPTRSTGSSYPTNVVRIRASVSTKIGPFYWPFQNPDRTFDPYAGSASGRVDWADPWPISSYRHRSTCLQHWRRSGSIRRFKNTFWKS